MMLIQSPRHRLDDLEAWKLYVRTDAIFPRVRIQRAACKAIRCIVDFACRGPCYAGVSWGKDSTVLAHLIWRAGHDYGVTIPLVGIVIMPHNNPDCAIVRDNYLKRYCQPYSELTAWYYHNVKFLGFKVATHLAGSDRYISGVRGAESRSRNMRMMRWGTNTDRTCAPLGWWPTNLVFAYLHHYDLPIHPAYACTWGGLLDRGRIRVGDIGGPVGTGHGRGEWEMSYYPDEVRQFRQWQREHDCYD